MNSVIDNMEAILIEAHKVKGWRFVHEQPLWVTWTLEKFGTISLSVAEMSLIRCKSHLRRFAPGTLPSFIANAH